MARYNERDRTRIVDDSQTKAVLKHTKPPTDQGNWIPLTRALLESDAYRSLSPNAWRLLNCIVIEHTAHGNFENGNLVVTHAMAIDYGVGAEYVADAIAELNWKGLVKVILGRRSGYGFKQPNIFTLTFVGTDQPATNEWKEFDKQHCISGWKTQRKLLVEKRSKSFGRKSGDAGSKENFPPRNSQIVHPVIAKSGTQ